jgi:hypothetical protein
VFDKKAKLRARKVKSKQREQRQTTERIQPNIKSQNILILLTVMAALLFLLLAYVRFPEKVANSLKFGIWWILVSVKCIQMIILICV